MNAHTSFRTPYGDECRKREAIRDVRERYWTIRTRFVERLAERMKREIARIEREGAR